ncbi:tetratricopeptide repeat protein [Plantactinospora siamensis]|uniref:Tetratricopeptide repeat protein n=1 Tax=Plantactinospora siamensis TaxID=555372 RepID=A0ABV6NVY0_9ACTN
MGDDRLHRAKELYETAVFGGDAAALTAAQTDLDGVEADLALARGRIAHARFLADQQEDPAELGQFERAVELYRRLGDTRGEAEALFWVGTYHQVIRGDGTTAVPSLQRSYDLAREAGDDITRSYAVRHLGFAAMEAGDRDLARQRLTESLELRRAAGFRAGVAAALLALAELAAESGDREGAGTLLAEATAEAEACGASGILRWIEAARQELAENDPR